MEIPGTAQWSKDPGHWRYDKLGGGWIISRAGGSFLMLGESRENPGFLHVRAPKQHILSIAPTRSGKGVSLIIPNLLTYRGSVLVVDPKGENAWITAARRRTLGQKTWILDPWNEVNRHYGSKAADGPEEIAHFNPLSILKPGSDDFIEDLAHLADALIITQSTKDPYWDDTARELWAGLMAYVVENPAFRERASLALARKLLMKSTDELSRTIKTAMELPGSVAALKLAQFENLKDSTAIMSVVSAARTQTSFLDSSVLNESMESSDFSFEELCEGNTSVYLVLPPDKLETYARWLRLMVSVGIRAVARGGSQSPLGLPTLFMLDEFGTIGKLNSVAKAYGLMAGLGMIMWTFSQDLNQLKRDYPEHWETFIGNSQALTCFGVMDNFTADYISKFLGTTTILQESRSTSSQPGSAMPSNSASVSAGSRSLLNPDEIRSLGPDLGLIMGGFAPIINRRIVYHEDWDLLHWAREDPHFPRTEHVRWEALQRRLHEMGSVARLLREYGFTLKRRLGRWKVVSDDGTRKHSFFTDDALWRWAYSLAMDGVDSA